MTTAPTLEVPPSSVFLYTPRSCDNLKPPLSPTSSIKGCFVRSRPTSAVFSEYEYNEFPGIDYANEGPSPITSEDESGNTSPSVDALVGATERWASHVQSDTRSLAPSTRSRMRIVRRSDADVEEEMAKLLREKIVIRAQEKDGDKVSIAVDKSTIGAGARRRTWPSYKAIRKTVSVIMHRKDPQAGTVIGKAGVATDTPSGPEPPVERLKSSSASLFSRRRRTTVSSGGDKGKGTKASHRAPVNIDTPQYSTQLRRSRSFSGFANVLSVINDDDDLDEVTTEASGLVEGIRRRWAFEEVPEEDSGSPIRFDMGVFEREILNKQGE